MPQGFDRQKYRILIKDHFQPDLKTFWRDFLSSYTLFMLGLILFIFTPIAAIQVVGYICAVITAYRCASFVHEIVHLPQKKFQKFIKAWNNLIGIPFMMPSVMYESHLDHHIPRKYGTKDDPEYLPLAGHGFGPIFGFIFHHAFITPFTFILRFFVGLPVRLISKKAQPKVRTLFFFPCH